MTDFIIWLCIYFAVFVLFLFMPMTFNALAVFLDPSFPPYEGINGFTVLFAVFWPAVVRAVIEFLGHLQG
jgi:hypothetical protein